MKTRTIRDALSKVQHEIIEILPHSGGDFAKRTRQEALFGETLDRRMDERDLWRVPAENWMRLEAIGRELSHLNDAKMAHEKAAAEKQRKLSQISREWQAMTDLARGRKPGPNGTGPVTTITVPVGATTWTSA